MLSQHFFLIGVQLIYNVVLISAVQQSDSVIHMHISTPFQFLFPYRSLQSTEQSSLCYRGIFIYNSVYMSFILYIMVCICQSQYLFLRILQTLTNLRTLPALPVCLSSAQSSSQQCRNIHSPANSYFLYRIGSICPHAISIFLGKGYICVLKKKPNLVSYFLPCLPSLKIT